MMAEYGRIHTDGSRSGGQPVLEPCPVPWCGSSDVKARSFDANHRRHWIECGKCNFKTPQMPSRTKVITLWNTRQPTHSNIFDASDVQKHTLIIGQDYASHTVKVKSLDDNQTTQGYGVVTAANYTSPIGGAGVVTHGVIGVAKDPAAEWQAGYKAGVEAAIKALEADAKRCDCAARAANECACGAWDDYKSITSARAVEIVRALQEQSK